MQSGPCPQQGSTPATTVRHSFLASRSGQTGQHTSSASLGCVSQTLDNLYNQDVTDHITTFHAPGEAEQVAPVEVAPSAGGLSSCALCDSQFPARLDLETHILQLHGEQPRDPGQPRDPEQEAAAGRDMEDENEDNEKEVLLQQLKGKTSESLSLIHSFLMLKLKMCAALREAAMPLGRKLRGGGGAGKVRLWPEIRAAVEGELAAGWLQSPGYSRASSHLNTIKTAIKQVGLASRMLKTVEGKFGSGVYNFFIFLKQSLLLNIFLSFLVLLLFVPEHLNNSHVQSACNLPPGFNISSDFFPENLTSACCPAQYRWGREKHEVRPCLKTL